MQVRIFGGILKFRFPLKQTYAVATTHIVSPPDFTTAILILFCKTLDLTLDFLLMASCFSKTVHLFPEMRVSTSKRRVPKQGLLKVKK